MSLKFINKKFDGDLAYLCKKSHFSTRVELIRWLKNIILLNGDTTLSVSNLKTVALCKDGVPLAVWEHN